MEKLVGDLWLGLNFVYKLENLSTLSIDLLYGLLAVAMCPILVVDVLSAVTTDFKRE